MTYNPKISCSNRLSICHEKQNPPTGDDDVLFNTFFLHKDEANVGCKPFVPKYEPISLTLSKKIVQTAYKEIRDSGFDFEICTLAKVHLQDLEIGHTLGTGGYSSISAVSVTNILGRREQKACSEESIQGITTLKLINYHGEPLAIKMLNVSLVQNYNKFANGAIDLILEAGYLSTLDHPNILKIHGISASGPEGSLNGRHDSFFLILSRLRETLQDRIKVWRKYDRVLRTGWLRNTKMRMKKKKAFLIERLKVAMDIASGLSYLHSNRLIHRDLKPANIGFDFDNQVKIFDLGLCGKLPSEASCDLELTHKLSGGIGTKKYMSPEVADHKPYNQGADVYSFGIVLYEILFLSCPIPRKNRMIDSILLHDKNRCPDSITSVMLSCLSPVIEVRPTMKDVHDAIELSISQCGGNC